MNKNEFSQKLEELFEGYCVSLEDIIPDSDALADLKEAIVDLYVESTYTHKTRDESWQ